MPKTGDLLIAMLPPWKLLPRGLQAASLRPPAMPMDIACLKRLGSMDGTANPSVSTVHVGIVVSSAASILALFRLLSNEMDADGSAGLDILLLLLITIGWGLGFGFGLG